MPKPTEALVTDLMNVIMELQQRAKEEPRCSERSCPLRRIGEFGHYDLTRIVFGRGFNVWTCEFCGEEHVD